MLLMLKREIFFVFAQMRPKPKSCETAPHSWQIAHTAGPRMIAESSAHRRWDLLRANIRLGVGRSHVEAHFSLNEPACPHRVTTRTPARQFQRAEFTQLTPKR
jgi:hypothetical protein